MNVLGFLQNVLGMDEETTDEARRSFIPSDYSGVASRVVEGIGGYVYEQFQDGSITILVSPLSRNVGLTISSGKAWEAITAEIGPFDGSSSVGQALSEPSTGLALGAAALAVGGLALAGFFVYRNRKDAA